MHSYNSKAVVGAASGAQRAPRARGKISLTARVALAVAVIVAPAFCWGVWLGVKASAINDSLTRVAHLAEDLKGEIAASDSASATQTVLEMRKHTVAAREAAADPLWTLTASLPWAGPNFSAVAEVSQAADDVVGLGLEPLTAVYGSLDWSAFLPSSSGTDLRPLKTAAPSMSSAAYAVRASYERLAQIDTGRLVPQVSEPLTEAAAQLQQVTGALDAAADASRLMPAMLGSDEPRSYLLIIQNNAEARASGGIPGALAIMNADNGKLALGSQASAGDVGIMSPIVPLDPEQQQIYSSRLGKFIQDVNLTPDFPTAAVTAQAMWERKTGQRVDGVISVDPVALGYILEATGPVRITNPELVALAAAGLPTELTGNNVVKTLLSDVYAKIEQPSLQDAYFAGVAQETFAALSSAKGNPTGMIEGITRGTAEGRVSVWSSLQAEQSVIRKYPLSGAIAGPSVAPAQFGVYFNDGTGAKMDYYVKRTVQLVKECPKDGYERTTVRVSSTNTAPLDAAAALPEYVTGGGVFGVPPGSVQTNVIAYGPVQANIQTSKVDGQQSGFAPYLHSNRPVGVQTIRLAPQETRVVEFTFNKIVQHNEPNIVVTPGVQSVDDVILPTTSAACGQGT